MGKLLNAEGYTNIEGADASQTFVDTSNASGWYTSCHVRWFGMGVEALAPAMLGKYDLVMATGVFLEGHIPPSGFDDAHAMMKTGGYFVSAIRLPVWENEGYKAKIDELVAAGKVELVKTWEYKRGLKDSEDPIFAEMLGLMFYVKRLDLCEAIASK